MRLITLLILQTICWPFLAAQPIHPSLLKSPWKANWITSPSVPVREYGVFHFRKTFQLSNKPKQFVIHVSADNRYRLYVNGIDVCHGPSRGDLTNWYFETIDISPWLKPGENLLAAVVWNMGTLAPVAQISNQTGFLLQGNTDTEHLVNTDKSWKVIQNNAYSPCSVDNGARLRSYMVVGPGDQVDAAKYPWGWEQIGFNDSNWTSAIHVSGAVPYGQGTDNLWTLSPRNIPLMKQETQRLQSVRRSEGIECPQGFLQGNAPLTIPAGKKIRLLLDQQALTVAYPRLRISQGQNASVTMTYAEALFDKNRVKGNRNDITGKEIIGNYDVFIPDGGNARIFQPLWFRTYRYLQLDIETRDQALILEDISGIATGYPFQEIATFSSNDTSLKEIWDIGWRTALLCAGETYFDCPYYEQLQYEGDTRIQSLISLYVAGDDRLMRKALLDFHRSRIPEGLTQGRYPSNRLQVIPPFSLFWVSMVHDYWMHRTDDAFVKGFLQAIRGVISWYENHIDSSKNMLGPMEWWNFVDWANTFRSGTPDGATNGNSAILSLQFAYTLRQAAELFQYFGDDSQAIHYKKMADKIIEGTRNDCYHPGRKAMANTPEKKSFSQHASIMAVLTNAVPAKDQAAVMNNILYDSSLIQATFYYRFYLTRALQHSGMADVYYSQLAPWRGMINNGLTTFAENPDPTRSDCHAWSSSPNYDFLATICGIQPAAPGFSKVKIQPAMGELNEVKGMMPHPLGNIFVHLKRNGENGIQGEVTMPKGLKAVFIWKDRRIEWEGGNKIISL